MTKAAERVGTDLGNRRGPPESVRGTRGEPSSCRLDMEGEVACDAGRLCPSAFARAAYCAASPPESERVAPFNRSLVKAGRRRRSHQPSCGFERPHSDLISAAASLPKVVRQLHSEPRLGTGAEGLGKPDGHFDRHSGLFIHKVRERLPCDAQGFRRFGHRKTQRFETLPPRNTARMRWIVHCHRISFLMRVDSLMIVDVIHIDDVPFLEAKGYPPIPGNRNAIMPFQNSFQCVQPESRQLHIPRTPASIQDRQNVAQLRDMFRRDALGRSSIVQRLEAAMFERPDQPAEA